MLRISKETQETKRATQHGIDHSTTRSATTTKKFQKQQKQNKSKIQKREKNAVTEKEGPSYYYYTKPMTEQQRMRRELPSKGDRMRAPDSGLQSSRKGEKGWAWRGEGKGKNGMGAQMGVQQELSREEEKKREPLGEGCNGNKLPFLFRLRLNGPILQNPPPVRHPGSPVLWIPAPRFPDVLLYFLMYKY